MNIIGELVGGLGKITAICLIIFIALVIGPLIMFWSINQLFQIDIAFTFWNWLAAIGLMVVFRGSK